MKYQQEFLCNVYEDIQELLKLHWEEVALNKDTVKLNPDWEKYKLLEDQGCLKIFTARDEGNLVGYFVTLVAQSLHYKDHVFATNDVVFLHPDYRKGFAAWKLIKFAEKWLKEDGVDVLFVNTKIHKPFDILLQRLGFKHTENLYSKRL